jgi:hypothetical protein
MCGDAGFAPGDTILVVHSYGGFIISNAAAGRSDVLGLVHTAAFVPDTGETMASLGAGYAPPSFLAPGISCSPRRSRT